MPSAAFVPAIDPSRSPRFRSTRGWRRSPPLPPRVQISQARRERPASSATQLQREPSAALHLDDNEGGPCQGSEDANSSEPGEPRDQGSERHRPSAASGRQDSQRRPACECPGERRAAGARDWHYNLHPGMARVDPEKLLCPSLSPTTLYGSTVHPWTCMKRSEYPPDTSATVWEAPGASDGTLMFWQ